MIVLSLFDGISCGQQALCSLLDKNGIQQQFQNDFVNIEVISNIYENPELLNNNK